jgi:YbbR domain-containing protein
MKMVPIEVNCIDEHATEITWTAKTDSMAIVLEAEDTASKSIRIEREGTVKEGYYLYECTTDTSLVSVKGAASQVANVKEVVAKVDIEGIKDSGDPEIPLYAVDEEGQIIDAKKITLVPDTVTVHLTINPIKEIPLSVYTTGNPGLYYYVGDIEFAPETIKVTATAEVLNNLEKLDVEVKLGNAEEDIESQINLEEYIDQYYRHLGIKVVDSSATMMGIKVPVIKMTEMTLDIKPEDINIIGTDESLKYTIQQQMYGFTPKIVVRGKAEELENIEASDFGLFINVTGLGKGSQSIQVECNYDGDLILEPGKVNLVIEEKPAPTPTENESNANQDREIQ